ncbi:MAG: transglycosylase domain-containing protein [Proteobacteria bacterium]|nr:transglycosylase domain-containing protein [Pseudomonadota bacterium]
MLLWFAPGLLVGLFVPWYLYLQFIVGSLFVEYNWSIPSEIYARELSLYNNKQLSLSELDFELTALGYQKKTSANKIGEYSSQDSHYKIFTKGFKFLDKTEKSRILSFQIHNKKVTGLNTAIARLEPLLIGQFYSKEFENRQPIPIAQVPNTMVMGLQAVEDRNFKHHAGVDMFGIIRAMVRNLFAGKIVQGGSTITQQLIKNRLHYRSKSWLRKANEAVVALMLEQQFDKGKIIESYFNEIYWGQKGNVAIHGVKQAAQYYFSKSPKQLTIAEQALLIGIVKGPSWYHPIKQKQRAKSRRNIILNAWYETKIITKQQWQVAQVAKIEVKINTAFADKKYQDFIDLVKQQLAQSFAKNMLNHQGLKIFTTINPFIQNQIVQTLGSKTDKLGKNLQAAAVVSNAITGEILAVKGSKQPASFYNRAFLSKRQIGSLIKPFVYLAALDKIQNFTLASTIVDKPIKIKIQRGEYWQPKNYDGKSMGEISAKTALVKSRNQATVNLGLQLGVNVFVDFLQQLGLKINRSKHPSVFLGATELTPIEVTNLFLILSSSAQSQQLATIKYVTDNDNILLSKMKKYNNLTINKSSIKQIRIALQQVTTQGTASKLTYKYGFHDLYGKTGTTNAGKNSWFVGFDNNYLATFWVGKDDNTATNLTGSSSALVLWADWYSRVFY